MFDKIKWVVLISLLGYIAYTDFMNDVRYEEHRKDVQLFMNEVNSKLGRELSQKIYHTSVKVVDKTITSLEHSNLEYISKVDSVLNLHEENRAELMLLLNNKIDFYGDKIDYFESSLDSTIESYTLALDMSVSIKDDLIRHQLSILNDKLSEVDSMMYKLQNNWLTKGVFK